MILLWSQRGLSDSVRHHRRQPTRLPRPWDSPGNLSVTPFCFQDFGSFSLSLFRILYQVDSLSLPFVWFGGHLSCFFTCWVFLCLFLLFILLFGVAFLYSGSLWSSLYCGVSSLWVGLDRWLVKVSWLGKLVSVFWWVKLDFFSLECN